VLSQKLEKSLKYKLRNNKYGNKNNKLISKYNRI
jgi:hypothetical protein